MPIRLNIEQILRTSEVRRWHIVRLAADQSVGEHVYNVIHLSIAIYDELLLARYDKDGWSVKDLLACAIDHDIEEGLTGDIPSPAKQMAARMGFDWNRAIHQMVGADKEWHPCVRDIVKLADLIDAWRFVSLYRVNRHGDLIAQRLHNAVMTFARGMDEAVHWAWVGLPPPIADAAEKIMGVLTGPVEELIDVQ